MTNSIKLFYTKQYFIDLLYDESKLHGNEVKKHVLGSFSILTATFDAVNGAKICMFSSWNVHRHFPPGIHLREMFLLSY